MSTEVVIKKAWAEHQKQLLFFIRSRVSTVQDAEDIASDVFTKLIQQANYNKTPDNISSWLYQVTRNAIIDYYRSRKLPEDIPEDLIAEEEENSALKQLSPCLLPMIQALPDAYRQVLIRSEIEGKKYKELATELGISLSAVKSRVLRGREKLHKSITACCSLERDATGNIMDYQQKTSLACRSCD